VLADVLVEDLLIGCDTVLLASATMVRTSPWMERPISEHKTMVVRSYIVVPSVVPGIGVDFSLSTNAMSGAQISSRTRASWSLLPSRVSTVRRPRWLSKRRTSRDSIHTAHDTFARISS